MSTFLIFTFTLVEYEFAHKPELFSYTKLAKQDPMRLTNMAKTGQNALGGLTATNAAKTQTLGFFQPSNEDKADPTSHWKT